MSPSVNRSSDSPLSSGEKPPEVYSVHTPHAASSTDNASNELNFAEQAADSTEIMPLDVQRQQPIPPPSEPMQYRAIGLVRGQYMPSADQLTRGTVLATDGTLIDAVLLGRVMSLVKNHLSLDQAHLWVVYPRSRQEDGNLHVQIVGVWEPEKLNQNKSTEVPSTKEASENPEPELEASSGVSESEDSSILKDGYFSIRGEVIYHSREEEKVVVKIKQSPRKESEKTKFFKLKLNGFLGDKVIGHFWDFHVQLQANNLQIQEANDIGLLPVKKRPKNRLPFNKRKRPDARKNGPSQRPTYKGEQPAAAATPPKRRDPLPKPVKRGEPRGGSSTSKSSS